MMVMMVKMVKVMVGTMIVMMKMMIGNLGEGKFTSDQLGASTTYRS